jgi:calmodulin
VGKAVAEDTLAEYKKAFNLFDKDGSGAIDADELGTVMKSLGVDTTPEEVAVMLETADADGSGEVDFNEFLALMTDNMGTEGEERLRNAKIAFWALQSYKFRAEDGSTSEWLCISELQELMTSGQLQDTTEIL